MAATDAVVLVIFVGFAMLGFKRGFARELVETFGAVMAAVIAYRYATDIAHFADIQISDAWWSSPLIILGTFIACMILLTIAGRLLSRFVRSINLGMYDHLAGFVLGALKGGMLIAVVSLGLLWIGRPGERIVSGSRFARANLMVFDWLSLALPKNLEEKYSQVVGGVAHGKDAYYRESGLPVSVATDPSQGDPRPQLIYGTVRTWDPEVDTGTVAFEFEGDQRTAHFSAVSFADNRIDTVMTRENTRLKFALIYLLSEDKLCVWSPSLSD